MIAAKAFDPMLGVDIHIVQPPGPVPPLPIPHPFIGMVIDPMDFAPIIGATVMVNGMPRATAGTGGMCIPPHIPIGGVFVKPPANEGDIFMGSATVLADGDPLSFLGMPVLSCHDIGMPPIPRIKKKRKPKSLALPTTVVLAIPAGAPVLVGGPPTISMMALGMKAAMAGLGKAFKKLKKVMKGSRKVKAVSDKIQKAAKKAMDKLGVPPNVQNKVHRAICSVTGHPVDVATGKVFTDRIDFKLPGPIDLVWERVWYSTSIYNGPLGHGWHHAYDISAWLEDGAIAIRMGDGRPLAAPQLEVGGSFTIRGDRLTILRDPEGYALRDSRGLLYRFARVDGRWPAELPLSRIEDRAGNRIEFRYDASGRLGEIRDAAGRNLRLHYNAQNQIKWIDAPHPTDLSARVNLVTYEYDQHADLIEVRDANGFPQRFTYFSHLLVRETNRNGVTFHFAYDSTGPSARCVRTAGDGGIFDHKLLYHTDAGITVVEDSLGQHRTYQHDGAVVQKTIDPLGGVRLQEHDEDYLLVAEVDEAGARNEYAWDETGNLIGVVRPGGAATTIEYDHRMLPVQVTDPNGGIWRFEYDDRDRLSARVDPAKAVTRFEYRDARLVALINPKGESTRLQYDTAGNLAVITDANGSSSRWTYDELGRPIESEDENGSVQRRSYDLVGRLVGVENPDGNIRQIQYNGEGNVVHARDQVSDVSFTYSGLSAMASKTEAGTTIRYEYNTEQQLLAIINEQGSPYRFVRDARGRVMAEVAFDGAQKTFVRDAVGRAKRVDGADGRFTEFDYDDAGRLVLKRHSDGTTETFRYRPDGYLIAATNNEIALTLERDPIGRVLREVQGKEWVASAYDDRGLRVRLESSRGARHQITRDDAGRATKLRDQAGAFEVRFAYDDAGLEVARYLPGNVVSQWQRDAAGRPGRQWVSVNGQDQFERVYQWDANDRLRSMVDSAWGAVTFKHDPLGTLIGARWQDGEESIRAADATRNLYRTFEHTDRRFGPAGQLLEAAAGTGTVRYAYDGDGNLTQKVEPSGRAWTYEWNGAGMLSRVKRPDGEVLEFGYDPLGRRVRKTTARATVRWVWDGHHPLHEWQEAAPASRASAAPSDRTFSKDITWVFQPDGIQPVAKLTEQRAFGIVADHVGAPIAMFDAQGEAVWKAEFGIWGELRRLTGTRSDCPFRGAGQYEDVETGLYYNRFRYYDPESGQYISRDPLRVVGGLCLYAYVSDPHRQFDTLGLNPDDIALGLSVAPVKGPDGTVIGKQPGALSDFAKDPVGDGSVKAGTWTSFDEVVDQNGLVDMEKTISNAMDDAERIHFNVQGMDNWEEICKNPDPTKFKPPSTNWELSKVMSDEDLKKKTQLYDGPGKPVKCPAK